LNLLDSGPLTVSGAVGATGGVTLNTSGALAVNNNIATGGGNLSLTGVDVNQGGGTLTVGGTTSVIAGTGTISLAQPTNNFTGAVTLNATGAIVSVRDVNALTLAAPTLGANTGITAIAGTTLTLPVATNFSTGTGNIDLRSNGGALGTTGTLTTNSGTVTLVGSTGLTVANNINSTSGAVSLTGGAAGGLTVNAGIGVNAGSGTIAVNGGAGTIQLNNSTLTTSNATASAVTIQNATTVALGNITAANAGATLTLGAGNISGAITQTAATVLNVDTVTANTSSSINLGLSNTINTLGTITRGGALTVNDTTGGLAVTGPITGGTITNAVSITTAGGALAVNGNISTSGANNVLLRGVGVTQSAVSTVNAGAGTLLVDGTANTNPINMAGTLTTTNATATAVTFQNASTVALPNVNAASGTLVIGGGNIAGAVTQTATDILNVGTITANTTGSIDLATGSGANTIGTLGSITRGGALTVNDTSGGLIVTGPITGGTITNAVSITTAGGALAVNGSISTSGANNLTLIGVGVSQGGGTLTVGGSTTVNANAGVINLAQPTNNFTGAVSLNNSGANNVALTNSAALLVGTSSVGTGTLGLTAGGGITQSGAITQAASAGAVTIASSVASSDILLNTQANNISGTIAFGGTLANIRDVGLRDINASSTVPTNIGSLTNLRNLTLQFDNAAVTLPATTLHAGGNLSVTAGGAISQAGALTVPGTANFTTGAFAITLNTGANDFTGAVSLNNSGANNVTIADANAIVLGPSSMGSGVLSVTATGANSITQSGAILQASGAAGANFTTGAGAVTLTQANDFTGPVAVTNTGGNVAITDINTLTLGTVSMGNTANTLAVNATGAITQSGVTTITSGTGGVSFNSGVTGAPITLTNANDFRGAVSLTTAGANDASVNDVNNLALGISSVGGGLTATAVGSLTLNGNLSAGGAGDSIVLSASSFNNSGAFSLNPGVGRFLVWSSNPALDNRGGLAHNFKQYNAAYGVTTVLGSGNGFLYTLAPTITPSLTGTVSKTYDGNTAATLNGPNYSVGGAVDGDSVALNNPAAGLYNDKNAGTNKNVSVSGIAIASATNGGATVYGYTLGSSTANANIGTITPKALSLNAVTDSKTYDGTVNSAVAPTTSGLVGGDTVSLLSQSFASKNVLGTNGSTLNVDGGYAVNDGNGGGNYSVTLNSAVGTITQRALTGAAIAGSTSIYGNSLNPGAVTFTNVVGGDTVNSAASVNTTTLSGSLNPIVGSYTQTASATLTGADAANYSFGGVTSAANYTITQRALTGAAIAGSTSIYGNALNPGAVSFGNAVVGDTVNSAASVNTTTLSASLNPIAGSYTQTASTTLTGGDAANYSFGGVTSAANYTITQRALTGAAIAGSTSIYGNSLNPGAVTFTNVVGGDGVSSAASVNTTTLSSSLNPIVGSYTQTASTTLTGADAANYSFGGVTSAANYTITQRGLTGAAIAGSTSIYGNALNPGAVTFGNSVVGDAVASAASVNTTTLSTSLNPIVGSYTQTASTTLTGADAANYSFGGVTSAANYTITQRALTGAAIAGNTSIYGNSLNPGAVTFGNAVVGDAVNSAASVNTTTLSTSLNPIVGSYTQTASTTLTGADAANYSFGGAASAANYTITQRVLTGAAIAGSTSIYGNSLNPGAVTFGNSVVGDAVASAASVNTTTLSSSLNPIVGSYTQSASTTLTGADAANYSFGGITSAANYTITQRVLTGAAISGGASIYGSTLNPGAVSFGNAVVGDTVASAASVNTTTLSGSLNPIVGSYTQTASTTLTGADATNYSFGGLTSVANYTITQRALTGAAIAGSTSIYGNSLNPGAVSFGNAVAGDTVSSSASVNTAAVSSSGKPVVGSYTQTAGAIGGADAANYSFGGFTSGSNYTISQLALTGSVTAASSTYGSALTPGAASLTNVVGGDLVTATIAVNTTGLTSTSGNLTAGTHTGIQSVTGLGGADGGNYSFAGIVGNYTVNKLALTGTITAANKTYDATTAATITGRGLTGAIGGDVVSYTGGTATFSDQNVAVGKVVTGAGLSLLGTDAGNYTVNGTAITAADISQTALTIAANNASRNFGVANPAFSASYTGLMGADTPVVLTGTLSFTTPATLASPLGPYPIVPSGQTSTNYAISYVNGVLTVTAPAAGAPTMAVPAPAQQSALQMLGLKSAAELWSDCVGGGKASGGGGVVSGGQQSCSGGTRSVELPRPGGI
jgi:hypothetical protein